MLLKCIDNDNVENELTKGKIYELLTQNEKFFRVVSDKRTEVGFFKERFLFVNEELHVSEIVEIKDRNHIIRSCEWHPAKVSIGGEISGGYVCGCYPEDLPAASIAEPEALKVSTAIYGELCMITDPEHIIREIDYINLKKNTTEYGWIQAQTNQIGTKVKDVGIFNIACKKENFPAEPIQEPPASVTKINDVVAKLGSIPVGGGVTCATYGSTDPLWKTPETTSPPRVEQLWTGRIGAWKPDEITNLCKEIKMVDKHVDCPGSELKSYNSDATVRKFVARGATYWLLEPAKTFGMIAVRSVRYIAFVGLFGGSGYVAYDPSAAMAALKSCIPHVTIEAPSILGEK